MEATSILPPQSHVPNRHVDVSDVTLTERFSLWIGSPLNSLCTLFTYTIRIFDLSVFENTHNFTVLSQVSLLVVQLMDIIAV
jgi:hypothetical protein